MYDMVSGSVMEQDVTNGRWISQIVGTRCIMIRDQGLISQIGETRCLI